MEIGALKNSVNRVDRAVSFARKSDPAINRIVERIEALESMIEDLAVTVQRDKRLSERLRGWLRDRKAANG